MQHNHTELAVLVPDFAAYEAFARDLDARGYSPTPPGDAAVPRSTRRSAVPLDSILAQFPHAATILVVTADGTVPETAWSRGGQPPETYPTLAEIETAHIRATLDGCGWRCRAAARLLGIDRSTLYRKMKKYDIVQG